MKYGKSKLFLYIQSTDNKYNCSRAIASKICSDFLFTYNKKK